MARTLVAIPVYVYEVEYAAQVVGEAVVGVYRRSYRVL